MTTPMYYPRIPTPATRRLRAFAFDPLLSRQFDTALMNEITMPVPWDNGLAAGPVDEYLEVVDYDPTSQAFYAPVDLNDPRLLAQDGFAPSEGNPQFHQQMVYAVARTTIQQFERALGRHILWAPHGDDPVQRLRIYPHALREANAYYHPGKNALLFGYYPAEIAPDLCLPGETVFTCLSHDIVVHETTHAILDGMHRRYIEPSNPDSLALHEAFADLVALFQHFTYPEVVRDQIARTKGQLDTSNFLGQLAFQFGQTTGHFGALRSAIGDMRDGKWVPNTPDPEALAQATKVHDRGAILVAAVFDAFLTIYNRRIADLVRLATGGSGVLPRGALHPDLVERLSQEAAKTAQHFLTMCIRAFDYCPPVDVDFGDYLRALITADYELVSDDPFNYRLAVVEAFRRRGIYPRDVRNLSIEALRWHQPTDEEKEVFKAFFFDEKELVAPDGSLRSQQTLLQILMDISVETDRKQIFMVERDKRALLHEWLTKKYTGIAASHRAGLVLELAVVDADQPAKSYQAHGIFTKKEKPTLEVHSLRPVRRTGPDGQSVEELVIEITQRRRGYIKPDIQQQVDADAIKHVPEEDFIFRGGCTLLVNPRTGEVRYCITKNLLSDERLNRTRRFLTGDRTVYAPLAAAGTSTAPAPTYPTSGPLPAPESGVTVRMYNSGFGDCFLLAFPGDDDKPRYVLIDFGVIQGDKDGHARIPAIARDIMAATNGNMHAIAITHAHADHLSGFGYSRKELASLKTERLWLSWLEESGSSQVQHVLSDFKSKVRKFSQSVTRLGTDHSLVKEYRDLMAFGLTGALGISNAAQYDFLHSICTNPLQQSKDYLKPGSIINIAGVPGVNVYVLGPPTSSSDLKVLEDETLMYPENLYKQPPAFSSLAVKRTKGEPFTREEKDEYQRSLPFDITYLIPQETISKINDHELTTFISQHYGPVDQAKTKTHWQRIDDIDFSAEEALAIALGDYINNTSLVLAIELVKTGKVLLFVGDAQAGNWKSWQGVTFNGGTLTGDQLLQRTVFYKMGHHGSRNATMCSGGLALMQDPDLMAMIPVNQDWASHKTHPWHHPEPEVLEPLLVKTQGRILRSDQIPEDKAHLPYPWQPLENDVEIGPNQLWVQLTVR